MPIEYPIGSSLGCPKEKTIILLSCSHRKRAEGLPYDNSTRSLVCDPTQSGRALLEKRRSIASMLRHDKGYPRLYNKDQNGGYRDEQECNRDLKLGPDLGGEETGGFYLPAHERYLGRFFSRLLLEIPDFWKRLPNPSLDILFVSGLYGLVFWDELIQEYDCHFNDYTTEAYSRTLKSIWFNCLSESLCAVVKSYKSSSEQIRVFDLLSEESYQRRFDWNKVQGSGATVYHRVFKSIAGPDILQPLAVMLAQEFRQFLTGSVFRRGEWYALHTEEAAFEYGFEYPIFSEPDASREGDTKRTREEVLERFPRFMNLPNGILKLIVIAEHSWETINDREFDFGVIVVSFSKPVEALFRLVEPRWQVEPGKPLALGTIAWKAKSSAIWEPLSSRIEQLNKLRGEGAHPGRELSLNDAERARELAFDIIVSAEKIWPR